ncbi:MAG: 50S ribosomal protein L13 [Candidatus Pacebacteria bacterium]|nr:50S ribosomal protein L13 [Candidatus Paceibacterota bacterium]MBP9867262.1 50S ribosomal protein L13 [Candidatus Paceibacterota bacterium]
MNHTIDATDRALGRVATEVASILNAKNSIHFVKNRVAEVSVKVINASKMKVTGNKMKESVHKSFSGYPGGLKEMPLQYVVEKKGFSELLTHAVRGMLPKNKLQDIRMKNLVVEE